MSTKKSKYPRARQLWFCTNVYALNGKKILDLDECERICKSKINLIDKYAIGLHDADKHDAESIKERESHRKQLYMERYQAYAAEKGIATSEASESGYVYDEECKKNAEADVDFYYPAKQIDDDKELHIHCVIKLKYARYIDQIANWFGIPVTMIDIKSGHHVFEDCAEYLVHKKQPEKHNYEDVITSNVRANFDYAKWLDDQVTKDELHEKYHIHIDDLNDIVNEVATNGLSLKQVEEMVSPPVYLRNKKLFFDARQHFIYNHLPMPSVRHVFYVDADGKSGAGKSIATKALCKQFARDYGADITKSLNDLKEYIYKVGSKGVAWDKYDGQPIVFIDDREAIDMLVEFGGHEGVKNLLERFPEKESLNIKYGNVIMVAKYIVINGIQPFNDFINGLNGTYTSKDGTEVESDKDIVQYHRRITGIVKIMENDIVNFLFNKGIMQDTREYEQYTSVKLMAYNFQRTVERLQGSALASVETVAFDEMVSTTKSIDDKYSSKVSEVDDLPEEFKNYGKAISADDLWEEAIAQKEADEIEEMLLLREYSTTYTELWVAVYAERLISHETDMSRMFTFENWKANGCPNAWDKDKGFYREEKTTI